MIRILTTIIFTMTTSQVFAAVCSTGLECPGGGQAAPGPIAGAGLAYLVLAGGYYAARRWWPRP